MDPRKRRGYPLRRWLGIDAQPRKARRRSLVSFGTLLTTRETEPEPEPDVPDDYPDDAIRRNYAAWGCSPPPAPNRRN